MKTVTLITGDRVLLSGKDYKNVAIIPGKDRRNVTFHTHRRAGKLRVVPSDAEALVASGRLDPRLFDVTELIGSGYDDDRSRSLPLIVTYDGVAGRTSTRGLGRATRELPAVNGSAVRVAKGTNVLGTLPVSGRRFGGGIERVWLDGKRRLVLDQTVPQIGAPAAWQAGFTGTGVTVAVLDTGVDATHPDLVDRIVEARNFTTEPAGDQVGHGTHVASTIAGTGAASEGRYKGVAPDARLLDGKVCESQLCEESAILAGMQWAAAEKKADVINLSLGGGDTPGIDPMEEAVNTLTAQTGTLFVIAAGNDGPAPGTVSSPGSAESALTVGAVDTSDELASFSSRGPRVGDAGVKPDVTAPGVDVVAARAKDGVLGEPVGEHYLRLSGTSMATPHTAGAAALLAQQHPDWTPGDLKSALMASAKSHAQQSVFEQGAGRIDLAGAVKQEVFAQSGSLSFGAVPWPHDDDTPVVKQLTFRNTGSAASSLSLQAALNGPSGDPAPAGALTLSATSITVPAGGAATVTVTSNTNHDGVEGVYSGSIKASGAGTGTFTVPVSVDREVEKYDLTVTHLDPDGKPTATASTWITDIDTGDLVIAGSSTGVAKVRLPRGRYFVEGNVSVRGERSQSHALVQPILELDKAKALAIDARLTRPVTTTVPRSDAGLYYRLLDAVLTAGDEPIGTGLLSFSDVDVFTAPLGEPVPAAQFSAGISSVWGVLNELGTPVDSPYSYHLMNAKQGSYWHGFNRRARDSELAKLSAQHNWHGGNRPATKFLYGHTPQGTGGAAGSMEYTLPSQATHYVEANGVRWSTHFWEFELDFPNPVALLGSPYRAYQAGNSYSERWNGAVFGPSLTPIYPPDRYVSRTGDRIFISIPEQSDSEHAGSSAVDGASAKLYRNGDLIAENPGSTLIDAQDVPAAAADFKLISTTRRPSFSNLSTRLDLEWNFRSGTASTNGVALPFWAVRYTPQVDSRNTMKRQPLSALPLRLESAPGAEVGSLTRVELEVSGNDGTTWTPATVRRISDNTYLAVFATPAGSYVSLKANAADSNGNSTKQTIIRAYALS